MLHYTRISFIVALLACFLHSCNKSYDSQPVTPPPPPPPANYTLSYGDSVFYLHQLTNDIVSPTQQFSGKYYGFPEGIQLDENSGDIDISKSETGLKYRISFVPTGSIDTFSTTIVISGINFLDGFYRLSTGDSVVFPLYNAKATNAIPGLNNGSVFDEGSNCNSAGCTVNVINGQINLAQTVRNGVFGTTPSNNDRHEFELDYRINDKSGKALNSLKVKLYYFDSMSDVTQEVYDIISSREGTIIDAASHALLTGLPIATNSTTSVSVNGSGLKTAKPRPPCIFIVSH